MDVGVVTKLAEADPERLAEPVGPGRIERPDALTHDHQLERTGVPLDDLDMCRVGEVQREREAVEAGPQVGGRGRRLDGDRGPRQGASSHRDGTHQPSVARTPATLAGAL